MDLPSGRFFFARNALLAWTSGDGALLKNTAFAKQLLSMEAPRLPFVIPSEAEGSAVQRTSRGNVFHPLRWGPKAHDSSV
jgi:hypothetical protein